MEKIIIKKLDTDRYCLERYNRSFIVTAQCLLDIGDWYLQHMNELEKEASQERNADALNEQKEEE